MFLHNNIRFVIVKYMKGITLLTFLVLVTSCASNKKVTQADDVKPYLIMLKHDDTLSKTEKENLKRLPQLPIKISNYKTMGESKAICWMADDIENRRLEFVQSSFYNPKTVELYTVKKVDNLPSVLNGTSLKVKRKYLLVKRSVLDCLNKKFPRNGRSFVTIERYISPINNKSLNIRPVWRTNPVTLPILGF